MAITVGIAKKRTGWTDYGKLDELLSRYYAQALAQQVNRKMFTYDYFYKGTLEKYKEIPAGKRDRITIAIRMAGTVGAQHVYPQAEVALVYYFHPRLREYRRDNDSSVFWT